MNVKGYMPLTSADEDFFWAIGLLGCVADRRLLRDASLRHVEILTVDTNARLVTGITASLFSWERYHMNDFKSGKRRRAARPDRRRDGGQPGRGA